MSKPFDLKSVLEGKPVSYRNLVICEFLKLGKTFEGLPVLRLALLGGTEEFITATLDGKVLYCTDGGDTQLHMAPVKVKKTVYVNLYPDEAYPHTRGEFGRYNDRETATRMANKQAALAVAVPVEIEVEESEASS